MDTSLTPADVANLYDVSVSTVKRRCADDTLDAVRLSNGAWLIDPATLASKASDCGWELAK